MRLRVASKKSVVANVELQPISDDVINTCGEKVAAREVEQVLATLPGVVDVAVYGVDDVLLGQAVATSLTVAANARLTVADVKHHCRRYLDDYMVPKYVDISVALPSALTGWGALMEMQGETEKAA